MVLRFFSASGSKLNREAKLISGQLEKTTTIDRDTDLDMALASFSI
jgi:hypothetical protein